MGLATVKTVLTSLIRQPATARARARPTRQPAWLRRFFRAVYRRWNSFHPRPMAFVEYLAGIWKREAGARCPPDFAEDRARVSNHTVRAALNGLEIALMGYEAEPEPSVIPLADKFRAAANHAKESQIRSAKVVEELEKLKRQYGPRFAIMLLQQADESLPALPSPLWMVR